MLRVEGEPAYILHARAYRETSLLLDVLSLGHGRLGIVARGVRGAKSAARRALLQPFQPLHLDWQQRGDLGQLREAETAGAALPLQGANLLAGFYLNELCLKLMPRNEAQPDVFLRYANALAAAATDSGLAWTLRMFERDLLAACGYGLDFGAVAEVAAPYWAHLDERGAMPVAKEHPEAMPIDALLALQQDSEPEASMLVPIRLLLRRLIDRQLGGAELRSRRLLHEFRADAERSGTAIPRPRPPSA